MTSKLLYFTYSQNNSGGSFRVSKAEGIAEFVIIQARSAKEADAQAETIGLYFDGCREGIDCDCCGDRWSRKEGGWYENEGTDTPMIYDKPAADYENIFGRPKSVAIHYFDGRVEWLDAKTPNSKQKRLS